jgi:hypothetical protein
MGNLWADSLPAALADPDRRLEGTSGDISVRRHWQIGTNTNPHCSFPAWGHRMPDAVRCPPNSLRAGAVSHVHHGECQFQLPHKADRFMR